MKRPAPPSPVAIEQHYSTAQAARLIGLSSGGLRNLRVVSKGPAWIVTADKRILYPASSIAAYLAGKAKAA